MVVSDNAIDKLICNNFVYATHLYLLFSPVEPVTGVKRLQLPHPSVIILCMLHTLPSVLTSSACDWSKKITTAKGTSYLAC